MPGRAHEDQAIAAVEAHFRRNGLPHLAVDYDPREDTLTRLWPALVLILLVGLAITLRPDWAYWQRALAVAAGAGIAIGGLILVNIVRGRRVIAPPEDVGFLEAGVFVFTPAIASLALGDGLERTAGIAVGSVVVAAVLYGLTSLGVLPMLVHQWRPALQGLATTGAIAVRALPPLIAVLLFLALASETWRAFGRLEGWRFGALLAGFGLLALVILTFGLVRERRELYRPEPGERMEDDAMAGPAAALVMRGVRPTVPPLSRLERINLAAALVLSIALRVLIVGAAVAAAFLAVSLIVLDRQLTAEWIEQVPTVLLAVDIAGREVVLTSASVRVAVALGAFASMYFVAVALGESRNREEFLDDELARIRRVVAAWAYYRGALSGPSGGASPDTATPRGESR